MYRRRSSVYIYTICINIYLSICICIGICINIYAGLGFGAYGVIQGDGKENGNYLLSVSKMENQMDRKMDNEIVTGIL